MFYTSKRICHSQANNVLVSIWTHTKAYGQLTTVYNRLEAVHHSIPHSVLGCLFVTALSAAIFVFLVRCHFPRCFMVLTGKPNNCKATFYVHILYFLVVHNCHTTYFVKGNQRAWVEQSTTLFEHYSLINTHLFLASKLSRIMWSDDHWQPFFHMSLRILSIIKL